ncbi:MAG: PilZ domain-containing protein [Nitrospirota bacterium]
MSYTQSAEQRPYVRVPFAGPATIRFGPTCLIGTIRDISFSGCFIAVPPRFDVGTAMNITISLDEGETQFIMTNARIVRRSPHGIGVRFSYIDARTPRVLKDWIEARRPAP